MNEDVHALAAAYSLDALDPDERRRFEAHYPDCETCRTEVREFRETAAHLGVTDPAPLPGDLKARVMAEVGRTRQLPPQVVAMPERNRWARPLLVAAAVLLVVLVGGGALALRSNDSGTGGGSELAQVMSAPDAVTVKLKGPQPGTLRVVYSKEKDRAVLVGSDLGDPGADKTYQLWAIDGTTPTSAGVFTPGSSGSVDQVVDAPSSNPDAWGVTVEPQGGSPAPTTEVLYSGTTA
jgi:anti-sigma-K factor RskA